MSQVSGLTRTQACSILTQDSAELEGSETLRLVILFLCLRSALYHFQDHACHLRHYQDLSQGLAASQQAALVLASRERTTPRGQPAQGSVCSPATVRRLD